jgi:hypothetical protein
MKTVSVSGTATTISFFEDDTIETVRQQVALVMQSHPDRLFIEVHETFPKDYYENPKHWTALFLRMSFDGKRITQDMLRTYLEQVRMNSEVVPREMTLPEWEMRPEELKPLFAPEDDFKEWRILGVKNSFVMPLPPIDLPDLKSVMVPQPNRNALFDSFHSEISEIRGTELPANASQTVMRNYYPYLKEDTPINIESLRTVITNAHNQIEKLLKLDAPKHERTAILKARWYIPLVSTRFNLPRVRFEQIFYGSTVSNETPYVGYFTSKSEIVRHKFFVKDPKNKVPVLDIPMWKSWLANTQPQRKLPTLLFYKGKSKHNFSRIAVTPKDITVSTFRDKESTETLEDLQKHVAEWMASLDALIPFLEASDISTSRWELSEISAIAGYSDKISEFDLRRFPCLQPIFSYDKEKELFRFLRTDSSDFTPLEIRAYQILNDADIQASPEVLANELNITVEEATKLFDKITNLDEDFNIEKTIKQYPVIKFSSNEVFITFVTSLERVLHYTDILRYVITTQSETDELNDVCPRRTEVVEASAAVPVQKVEDFEVDEDLMAALGLEEEEEPAAAEPSVKKSENIKINDTKKNKTYSYFNERLRKFDPTIPKDYAKKCEKSMQVVVITPERKTKIGKYYNYTDQEELEIEGASGKATAICPPYWCIRDEIPLREDQLVNDKQCPVCGGKIRKSDNENINEYKITERNKDAKYPRFKKNSRLPCCYSEAKGADVIQKDTKDEFYILNAARINPLRLAFLPSGFLGIKTNYDTSVSKGRIVEGKSDMFRIGIGRPSKTLPIMLGKLDKKIPTPAEAPEKLKACSFFRTWKDTNAEGETTMSRIVNSIDKAYNDGKLDVIDELEYVSLVMDTRVFRVVGNQVVCGFWSEQLSAKSRTILITETGDVIGKVERREGSNARTKSKFNYTIDITTQPDLYNMLNELNSRACSSNIPVLDDAIKELQMRGYTDYEAILDPFGRIQALLVPGKMLFPIKPVKSEITVVRRSGYADIKKEELPMSSEYLKSSIHPGFRPVEHLKDYANDLVVEVLLDSGFRVPLQPYEDDTIEHTPKEIVDTIRRVGENVLVDGAPNKEDIRIAEQISYNEEVFQFLLFSLSKDVQKDEYANLRTSIVDGKADLYKALDKWVKSEAYFEDSDNPIQFLNKIRTPCGQLLKDSCSKSSLCGWHQGSCKIKIKNTYVEKAALLRRLVKTLKDNAKQRSLVLDERLSPFFSTVLYIEMPNELITTEV